MGGAATTTCDAAGTTLAGRGRATGGRVLAAVTDGAGMSAAADGWARVAIGTISGIGADGVGKGAGVSYQGAAGAVLAAFS